MEPREYCFRCLKSGRIFGEADLVPSCKNIGTDSDHTYVVVVVEFGLGERYHLGFFSCQG